MANICFFLTRKAKRRIKDYIRLRTYTNNKTKTKKKQLTFYFFINLRVTDFPCDSILIRYIPEGFALRSSSNSDEFPFMDVTICPTVSTILMV